MVAKERKALLASSNTLCNSATGRRRHSRRPETQRLCRAPDEQHSDRGIEGADADEMPGPQIRREAPSEQRQREPPAAWIATANAPTRDPVQHGNERAEHRLPPPRVQGAVDTDEVQRHRDGEKRRTAEAHDTWQQGKEPGMRDPGIMPPYMAHLTPWR